MTLDTSTSPTARSLWRAARAPVIVGSAVFVVAVVLVFLAAPAPQGSLDPRSAGPGGTRALATLLRDEGVRVDLVRHTMQAREKAGPGTTLLVAIPDLLDKQQHATLAATGADVVLVAPAQSTARRFAPGIAAGSTAPVQSREPACALPAARAAGTAEMGGQLYDVRRPGSDGASGGTSLCYASGGSASLVQVRARDGTMTVLGSGRVLTNDALGEDGNAALSMRLLGEHTRVVWFLPDPSEALGGANRSVAELVPGWVAPAFWQLVVAVLLLAAWRARRLGPVVVEALPVVVRAAETVEGRAGLYRRSRARDRAAESLRAASRARLGALLAMPRDATPQALVTVLADRTGMLPVELAELLYGSAPGDDAALVSLADALDSVEGRVRAP